MSPARTGSLETSTAGFPRQTACFASAAKGPPPPERSGASARPCSPFSRTPTAETTSPAANQRSQRSNSRGGAHAQRNASDALPASGEAKTTAFLAAIFGSGVGDFVTLAASVHRHFESLVFLGVKHKLASYRHEQLLTIKAEIAQTYKTLRELQRQEILLTPPEEAHATTVSLTS